MVKRAAVVSLVMTAGLIGALERYGRRSGATRAEGRMGLPGDEIVRRPLWQSTRAITIDATPDRVWPWIVQMGFPPHRAGWYTPHWLDVAMWGERPRSAARIMPELQALAVGETVPDSADYSVYYRVESVQPPAAEQAQPAHLLLHSVRHVFGPIKESDFSWSFVLLPRPHDGTRMLVRARASYRPLWAVSIIEPLLNVGDLVNVTCMLRNIKRLVERSAVESE